MTTNITPIEALKELMEYECSTCIVPQGGDCSKCEPKRIYTQALAPQECDVTNEFDKFESAYNQIFTQAKLINEDCTNANGCSFGKGAFMGQFMMNCLNIMRDEHKQLHSQQKTFTVEEIENKIKKVKEFYGEQIVTVFINDLLAEFEKEVE